MFKVGRPEWATCAQGDLGDYVTALVWSPQGDALAAISGVGHLQLWSPPNGWRTLRPADGFSLDAVGFAPTGQVLATAGQAGRVEIWDLAQGKPWVIEHSGQWIDRLAWHPTHPQLAFNLGTHVQIWDTAGRQLEATLPLEGGAASGLIWHPQGSHLAVGTGAGVLIWPAGAWEEDPHRLATPAAVLNLAWSPSGQYLAAGLLDRSLRVWPQDLNDPWAMTGFPAKIRHLLWSEALGGGTPRLASTSADGLVVWSRHRREAEGWQSHVLQGHTDTVQALGFQPGTLMLATAGREGRLCMWSDSYRRVQTLEQDQPLTTLAWQPQGKLLAAGTETGIVLLWQPSQRGRGFGRP
ncbi:MAG: WD40 repeat domain-containing protein [Gloeomargaritaceae cyanobacterium C42_A2020_066]|nr:WD40 repeat domain-containing protein [Gloeomargaritaceae cyanobacterium C42_A2020_066]